MRQNRRKVGKRYGFPPVIFMGSGKRRDFFNGLPKNFGKGKDMTEQEKNLSMENGETPTERYTFRVDPARLGPVEKEGLATYVKGLLLTAIAGLTILLCGFVSYRFFWGLGAGILLIGLASEIALLLLYKKNFAKVKSAIAAFVYEYALYPAYLSIRATSEKEETCKKVPLQDIKSAHRAGDLILLKIGDLLYFVDSNVLSPDSYFFRICTKK